MTGTPPSERRMRRKMRLRKVEKKKETWYIPCRKKTGLSVELLRLLLAVEVVWWWAERLHHFIYPSVCCPGLCHTGYLLHSPWRITSLTFWPYPDTSLTNRAWSSTNATTLCVCFYYLFGSCMKRVCAPSITCGVQSVWRRCLSHPSASHWSISECWKNMRTLTFMAVSFSWHD